MRRLSHYDYWQDRLRPSLLADCEADIISYGMGEKSPSKLHGNSTKAHPCHQ